MILMLDFAKAYDSLGRPFLVTALEGFGFSSSFVRLIEALHAHTSALFQVNGERSRSVPVTRGVHQGCPLTPLLFLLAIETLDHSFRQRPEISGLAFRVGMATTTQVFAGFVDDSTMLLRRASDSRKCTEVLEKFKEASGLTVQP